MKRILLAFASVLAIAACETTPTATAADQFFGKELVAESGDKFIFNTDGTVGGLLRGEPVAGTFSADGTEICSEYTSPENLVGREFCSTPSVSDGMVVFNRRDGSQSQTYEIQG